MHREKETGKNITGAQAKEVYSVHKVKYWYASFILLLTNKLCFD